MRCLWQDAWRGQVSHSRMEETLPPKPFNPSAKAQFPPKVCWTSRTGALQPLARDLQFKGLQDHRLTLNQSHALWESSALLDCPQMSHGDVPVSCAHNMAHGDLPGLWRKEQGGRGQPHVAHMGDTYEDAAIWEVFLCRSAKSGQIGLGGGLI